MAARIGAGTGVVVSLVVFVFTTVALLVLAIVFYRGQVEAEEQLAKNDKDLARFVSSADRNSEWVKSIEAGAGPGRSVVRAIQEQVRQMTGLVTGDPDSTVTAATDAVAGFGAGDQRSVLSVLGDQRRAIQDAEAEANRLKAALDSKEEQLSQLAAQMQQQAEAHRQEIQTATASIDEYRKQAETLFGEVTALKAYLNEEADKTKSRHEEQLAEVNRDLDVALQDSAVLKSRIKEFEARLDEIRLKASSPDMLVDGTVIEAGASDEVFIDRGREHRIVNGMTFEVYDSASAIRPNEQGIMPRGKASIQVTKPGATTSTCKITRAVPGRPLVGGDVIANAIYDPTYKFKFLVHGKFDIDGDGKATDNEAEHLRSLVIEWGGTVITGEELPGDLDFLVLGEEPPLPAPPRPDASEIEMETYIKRRQARDKYLQLQAQAVQAQIPLLNANRFFILIGHTPR